MIGWDHPDTARYYSAFERRHRRYRSANRALVQQASLRPGQRVLDFAAGSGGTTAEILPLIGKDGRVDCVEPAAAMRATGEPRFDARVRWLAGLPDRQETYDRILCGAAIWQMPDLGQCLEDFAARLAPGGALSFNIPAGYLGLADRPGGGRDPWLVELPSTLAARLPAAGTAPEGSWTPITAPQVTTLLRELGLVSHSWSHTGKLSQAAYRDWLKLPVVSNSLLGRLNADERAAALEAAFEAVDQTSWRWERWMGWTAWKEQFPETSDSVLPSKPSSS